jgi:flavin reductase (DIM6/NTAB) family NADH-FMN oxidoreductase RutF
MAAVMGEPPGAVSLQSFRDAFAAVPMPVAVVTALADDRPHGTTVSSFCSLSAQPPLVMVALDHGSSTLRAVRETAQMGINVLAAGQEGLARVCATKALGKLDGADWSPAGGLPRLDGAAVWLGCALQECHTAGDHVILVGLVTEADVAPAVPLLYHRRDFGAPGRFRSETAAQP